MMTHLLRPLCLLGLLLSVAVSAAEADFDALLSAAEAGKPWQVADADHPLVPYLEHAEINRDLGKVPIEALQAFVDRHPEARLERTLRQRAIEQFSKAGAHPKVIQLAAPSEDLATDCWIFASRLALKQETSVAEAAALYRRADQLTPACKAAFDWLEAKGGISDQMRLERFQTALENRRFDLARSLRAPLTRTHGAWVERSYALHADPATALNSAAQWPVDPALSEPISAAVARLARKDPLAAEAQRSKLSQRYGFSTELQGRMQRAIAVYAAANRLPQATPWFARMDPSQLDDEAWAWRMRAAIQRREYAVALAALADLSETQKAQAQWSYLAGRLAEIGGQTEQARNWYAMAAREASFHGFLAADRIDAPYALCDATPERSDSAIKPDATLQRALAWWAQGQRTRAFREWWYGLQNWSPELRREAGLKAAQVDWHDAAVWALNGAETRNWYRARFPLAWPERTREQARLNALHPSWVRGLIRAESTWNPHARSAVGALGLMQVMPATGRGVAQRIGLRNYTLTDPDDSIALGTAYLRELMDRFDDQIILATAAYNAGPGAVERWPRSEDLPIDLWIETITYKETREYVPRVLAFKVIYDWRADGIITRLSDRIPGLGQMPRRRVEAQCPSIATTELVDESRRQVSPGG
jgi:soluble lytic murein transglycosylase